MNPALFIVIPAVVASICFVLALFHERRKYRIDYKYIHFPMKEATFVYDSNTRRWKESAGVDMDADVIIYADRGWIKVPRPIDRHTFIQYCKAFEEIAGNEYSHIIEKPHHDFDIWCLNYGWMFYDQDSDSNIKKGSIMGPAISRAGKSRIIQGLDYGLKIRQDNYPVGPALPILGDLNVKTIKR